MAKLNLKDMLLDKVNSNSFRAYTYFTISNLIFVFSGLVIHFFLGKYLGPESYGVYSIVIIAMSTLNLFLTSGLPNAASKFISKYKENFFYIRRYSIKTQIIFSLMLMLTYFLSAPLLARYIFHDASLTNLFRISSLAFPFYGVFWLFLYFYNGLHLFKKQALLMNIFSFVRIILIVSMTLYFKVLGSLIGYILGPLLMILLLFFVDKKMLNKEKVIHEQSTVKQFENKDLLRFAFPVVMFTVLYQLFINIDIFMIKSLTNDNLLTGLYNAVVTIGRIPYYLFSGGTLLFLPFLSSYITNKNFVAVKKFIKLVLKWNSIFIAFSIITIFILGGYLIKFLYSVEYIPAEVTLKIFIFGASFLLFFYIISSIFNSIDKEKLSVKLVIFGVILNIILNYFLIPLYGINGAAISTTISGFVIMILSIFFLYRSIKNLN